MKSQWGSPWLSHQAGFRKERCNPISLWTRTGAAAAFCYAGPLLRQAGGPPELPRWGLGIWPEQDKEQYKQHTAHLWAPVPPAHPSVMQRLAAKDCPGVTLSPREGQVEDRQPWTRRNSWVTLITWLIWLVFWKKQEEPFPLQMNYLSAYLL